MNDSIKCRVCKKPIPKDYSRINQGNTHEDCYWKEARKHFSVEDTASKKMDNSV